MEVLWHNAYLIKKTKQTAGRGKESIAVCAILESPSCPAWSSHFEYELFGMNNSPNKLNLRSTFSFVWFFFFSNSYNFLLLIWASVCNTLYLIQKWTHGKFYSDWTWETKSCLSLTDTKRGCMRWNPAEFGLSSVRLSCTVISLHFTVYK